MRFTKRVLRGVLAVAVVLVGLGAVGLTRARPASAVAGIRLKLDVEGSLTERPYITDPCKMVDSPMSRTNADGYVAVQYQQRCGSALFGVSAVGQMKDNGDMVVQYAINLQHDHEISYKNKTFTLHRNSWKDMGVWSGNAAGSTAQVWTQVDYF